MAESLTATELARTLSDVLNRVRYRGDTFEVVRNGEVVARLLPAEDPRRATLGGLLEVLKSARTRDPEFAGDLEQIQASQPLSGVDPWAS